VVESPCIAVCKIDYESGYCIGCNRTIEEITNWSSLDDSQKKKILTKTINKNPSSLKASSPNHDD